MAFQLSTLVRFEWPYMAEAVLQVLKENKQDDCQFMAGDGPQPIAAADSDDWMSCDDLRKVLVRRTAALWSPRVALPFYTFPWRDDAVGEFYLKYRKRNDDEVADYLKHLAQIKKARGLK